MAEKEIKPDSMASGNANQEPEKKMTKYDKKMQRRREEEMKQKRRKKISSAIIILVVAACIGAVIWTAYSTYQKKHGPYVTVGTHSVQKAEYDYYFYGGVNSFASTYGAYLSYFGLDLSKPLDQQFYSETMTWQDYFDQQAVEQIKNIYALTDEASANGFEYDAAEDYNSFAESMQSGAESKEMTVDEYCKAVFGGYATLEGLKPYVEQSNTASAYYDSIAKATEVTDDEINTYYSENKSNYDSVDYRICKIAADMPEEETAEETDVQESDAETEVPETMSEEEKAAAEAEKKAAEAAAMTAAKTKADEMLAKVKDEASFEKVYKDYAADASTESLNTNKKKAEISPSAVSEWLFDDARKAGDKTVVEYEAGNAYYVVYFLDRYLEHAKTVDVRHILISADASTDAESEEEKQKAQEEAMAAAKTKAEEIYSNWKNGEATEDSFAELAETYSMDPGSNKNGGLYEAVKEGDMVENFNNWIFDDARKAGDTDIVETNYGYHIMYFVGDNAEEWYVSIKNSLLNEKMNDYMANLKSDLEVTDKQGNISYLHETEAETESETTAATTEVPADSETAAE